ncbi:xylan 1,4-beta-xylosidase [Butyrivibrio proteoclasticus]|uniref:Xylan 1,4-beta-xylosidase n=1 Tax=Butyrivibrio proteoclasticus TaxID=43305 RepID=A0A1I5WM41_9FIRM|nr:family 43 glycosylhydrolase [Butyrivibrio proteoclasticus]SFQ20598.1 xylan 1,4-beta-xylosidase [Butyrivibrio proteoclasticus]
MDAGNITIYDAAKKGDFGLVKWIVEYSRSSLNEYAKGHRTALHFAAMSGNLQMFKYLTERCGLDPLKGDINLVTPWDIVHDIAENGLKSKYAVKGSICNSEHKEIEQYLEKRYSHSYYDFYRNPIRAGFFPDPSICRVGDDYYMVNSSFVFFPCIPISHSKDLIHWEIIGHAITNPKWAYLDELEGGRGYWAPDISFYEGRFYITATYRLNDVGPVYRRQIVVSSERPEGPYSEPVFIDEDGIDPSIFNDDDGRRYMLLNRGARIFEISKDATKKISKPQLLFYGDNKRAPEGPHLYKKDGYYYLLEAEGGTGPGHMVTVSRSRELLGVYEPCPYNPIMRQKDPDALIQRCGHGDMVETPDGRWYMVYLCGRKIGDGYSILGRETAIDPVTWTADGWPIVNDLKGPSTMQVKPYPDLADFAMLHDIHSKIDKEKCDELLEPEEESKDYISPCGLPLDYMTPRPFEEGDVSFDKGNSFVIKGSKAPISSVDSRNLVLRRQTSFSFEYVADMEIPELSEGQHAGISGYYDENTFVLFGLMKKNGKLYVFSQEHIGEEDKWIFSDEPIEYDEETIRFSMNTDYLKRTLSYELISKGSKRRSEDDPGSVIFATLPDVYYLCDEGYNKGKRFTGALVGMYAYSGDEDLLSVKFRNCNYIDI